MQCMKAVNPFSSFPLDSAQNPERICNWVQDLSFPPVRPLLAVETGMEEDSGSHASKHLLN